MNSRLSAASFLLLAITLSSCRFEPPAVVEQPTDRGLELPDDENSELGLQGPDGEITLNGSVLIWSSDASRSDMAEVVRGSKETRLAKGRLARYRSDVRAPLRAELADVQGREQSARQRANDRSSSAQREVAKNYFGAQLAEASQAGILTEADALHAQNVWKRYCQAKIWEWVATRLSKSRSQLVLWKQRPLPAALCAATYEELGLLSESSPACKPAGEQGSDYWQCMWSEGVMKTDFFVGQYEQRFVQSSQVNKREIWEKWLQDGTFAFLLQQVSPERVKVSQAFVRQLKPKPNLFCREFNAPGSDNTAFCDAFVPLAGEPKDRPDAALALMSPRYLINQVEDMSLSIEPNAQGTYIANAALLFPHAVQDDRQRELLIAFRKSLSALHRRDAGATLSEQIFGQLATGQEMIDVVGAEAKRTDVAVTTILAALDEESKVELAVLAAAKKSATEALDRANAEEADLSSQWTNSLDIAARAAAKQGVSDAFLPRARLLLRRTGAVTLVRMHLDSQKKALSGCWQDESPIDLSVCDGGEASVPGFADVELHWEGPTRLHIDMPLNRAVELGFSPRTASAEISDRVNGFNELPLVGMDEAARFKLELHFNRVDGDPFASGTAKVVANEETLASGGVSLLNYD